MKIPSFQPAWLFCLALIAGLFSSASIAASSSVPFRATIAFNEQVAPSTNANCFLAGEISGVGTAPRFGTVHLASVDCVNPLSPTSFLFSSDQVVLAFDGGDQIWAAYVGTLSVSDGSIRGTYIVIGGAGRFTNATGFGTIAGSEVIDFTTGKGSGQIQLKGTLAF